MKTRTSPIVVLLIVFVFVLIWSVTAVKSKPSPSSSPSPSPSISSTPVPSEQVLGTQIGRRTKSSDCVVNDKLPDSACTPGAVITDVSVSQICTPGYSSGVRNVSTKTKNQVFSEYGIASHGPGEYEVDHLISLELGGSNDIANLWPEAANPTPGFHQKDQVENYLHQQVCDGKMSLLEAQHIIATNWTQVYSQIK